MPGTANMLLDGNAHMHVAAAPILAYCHVLTRDLNCTVHNASISYFSYDGGITDNQLGKFHENTPKTHEQ